MTTEASRGGKSLPTFVGSILRVTIVLLALIPATYALRHIGVEGIVVVVGFIVLRVIHLVIRSWVSEDKFQPPFFALIIRSLLSRLRTKRAPGPSGPPPDRDGTHREIVSLVEKSKERRRS